MKGREDSLSLFRAHRTWMSKHKAACLADAYAGDRKLMAYLEDVLNHGFLGADTSATRVQKRIETFFGNLKRYSSDCY